MDSKMNRKLYVGNLNFTTTEDELRDLFGQVAPVASVSMIMDRETGRPRGFAFVEMDLRCIRPPRTALVTNSGRS